MNHAEYITMVTYLLMAADHKNISFFVHINNVGSATDFKAVKFQLLCCEVFYLSLHWIEIINALFVIEMFVIYTAVF